MSCKRSLCALFCVFALSVSGCFRIPDKVWKNPNVANILRFSKVMLCDEVIEQLHDNNVISGVKWQKLRLSKDNKKQFPKLSDTLDKYNEESQKKASAQLNDFIPIASKLSGGEYEPLYCTAETKLYIQRADNRILSFLEKTYKNNGEDAPEAFWSTKNLDPDTGEEVRITDVLTDISGISGILERKLCAEYGGLDPDAVKAQLDACRPEELTWTLDYQGIVFLFDPHKTPYFSDDALSVKLWFDEYPDLFNTKYTSELLTFYAVSLPIGLNMSFDPVPGDGARASVFVKTDSDIYASYKTVSVSVNGKEYTDEADCGYDFDVYLVFMNGKCYIYYDLESDNGYHKICGLDINGSEIVQIAELSGTGFYSEHSEEDEKTARISEYTYIFNDPFRFKLKSRFDILGTRWGYASFALLEEDGTPKMTDRSFNIESEYGITTVKPIDAMRLSDENRETIPPETVLYPLRTDGESYIDMKNGEGTEFRLEVDVSSWPRKVNGIPEDECFESLPYAG